MKKTVLITITLLVSFFSQAQLIDNKMNIYFGYSTGVFHGKETIKDGSFIFPSLYANYTDLKGLSFKCLVNSNPIYSLGLGFNYSAASGWASSISEIYTNSQIHQYSLSPVIQFHTKFTETGIYNRIKGIFEIAPSFGFSDLTLATPLFDIQSQSGIVSQPMNSRDIFYGIGSKAGAELSVTHRLGIYVAYSFQHNWITSKLYNDKGFSSSQLCLGLIMRLERFKRFNY